MIRLAIALLLCTGSILGQLTIRTTTNQNCVPAFRRVAGGPLRKQCTTENSVYNPICATAVDANMVETASAPCSILGDCRYKTQSGKTCQPFNYKGVSYTATQCSYIDGFFDLPWCSTLPNVAEGAFIGAAGAVNWDFCNINCLVTVGSSYDYQDPNNDWCTVDNTVCCPGSFGQQSPIDLVTASATLDASLLATPMMFSAGYFQEITGTLRNNGHTNTFTVGSGNKPLVVTGGPLGTRTFRLLQFHYHWGSDNTKGSEHTLNGRMFPLEVHLVHVNTVYGDDVGRALTQPDGLAVLGFFFEIGEASAFVESVNRNIRNNGDMVENVKVRISDLLSKVPDLCNFTTYPGSLTTPTCVEVVTWVNFLTPVTVSEAQLGTFRTYLDTKGNSLNNNFRPVQPLNNRVVKRSK